MEQSMKLDIIKVLEHAKNLIRTEKTWHTNWYRTNCNLYGNIGYCASGAIHQVQNSEDFHRWSKAHDMFNKVVKMMGYHSIAELNDVAGHASVMTAFDLAIQFLQNGVLK